MAPPAEKIPPLLHPAGNGRAASVPPENPPTRRLPDSALALLLLTTALAAARLTEGLNLPIFHCTFKQLTGFPCAFCGGTRSFRALTHLHFTEAFLFNPLAIIAALAFAVAALTRLFLPSATTDRAVQLLQRLPWLKLTIALIALNWIYLVIFLPR